MKYKFVDYTNRLELTIIADSHKEAWEKLQYNVKFPKFFELISEKYNPLNEEIKPSEDDIPF